MRNLLNLSLVAFLCCTVNALNLAALSQAEAMLIGKKKNNAALQAKYDELAELNYNLTAVIGDLESQIDSATEKINSLGRSNYQYSS